MMNVTASARAALLALCLGGTVLTPAPLIAQQSTPGDSAEITFWNSIKDSQSAAEFEAYLQAFPSGLFAPLARLRIQQLAAGNRPPPAQRPAQAQPAPPPANAFIDTSNRQIAGEIQSKLYNLNYQVKRLDGVFDTSTVEAIRDWQRRIEVEANGQMTEVLMQRLRNSKAPAIWGAVAYTANGTLGRVWNRVSRQEAEESAKAECRRRAGRKAACDTLTASDSACLAVATYRSQTGGTVYYGARVALQPDLARAISNALQQCQEADRSRGTCVNRVAFCANGSHER